MNWHLHLTVAPHPSWTLGDVAHALERDVISRSIKPVILTNVFDDARRNYKEIIPTRHFEGTEAEATDKLFRMGILLNNRGWCIRRLKIEGNPSHTMVADKGAAMVRQRALYYETHVQLPGGDHDHTLLARSMRAAISTTARNTFATFRHPSAGHVYERGCALLDAIYGKLTAVPRLEAAVLDTGPEMDDEWLQAASCK